MVLIGNYSKHILSEDIMDNYGHFLCDITVEGGETLHASYCVTKNLLSSTAGSVEVYGIKCTAEIDGRVSSQSHVTDISPNADFVCSLAEKLCACAATPIHLHDIAIDAIT